MTFETTSSQIALILIGLFFFVELVLWINWMLKKFWKFVKKQKANFKLPSPILMSKPYTNPQQLQYPSQPPQQAYLPPQNIDPIQKKSKGGFSRRGF